MKIGNNNFFVIDIVLIFFFIHGILYFIYPEQIYNIASSIKAIKYFLIFLIFIIHASKILFIRSIFLFILSICLMLINYLSMNCNFSMTGLLYIVPFISILLLIDIIISKSNLFIVVIITYFFVSFFGYFEYFDQTFIRNSYFLSGYRISSILVNPNNLGLFLLFNTIFLLENFKKNAYSIIVIVNTTLLLYFSFSKTSIILFLIYLCVRGKNFLFLIIPIVFIFTREYFFKNYEMLILSLIARFEYNRMFFKILTENPIMPFFNNYQYTDNVYLNLYGNFSIFLFIIFIIFNQFILLLLFYKKYFNHIFYIILFLITGLSENFLYLSPLAYIYWGYMFWLFKYKLKISFGVKIKNE